MNNNRTIKQYKIDLGSKLFILSLALLFLVITIFTFKEAYLLIKVANFFVCISFLYVFLLSLKCKIIISDLSIVIKFCVNPFSGEVSQEVAFKRITRVYDLGLLFDDHFIFLYYGFPKEKNIFFPVGLGFPCEILNDIVARLPAGTQVDLDPYMQRRLRNLQPVSVKKLILLAVILISLVVLGAWYFWPR